MLSNDHRYHRPLREQRIQAGDFREQAECIETRHLDAHAVNRVRLRLDWPRFFDETSIENSKPFVMKKIAQLLDFWNDGFHGPHLTNMWLELGSGAGKSTGLRLARPITLGDKGIEWFMDPLKDGELCFSGRDSHPQRVPVGEHGTVHDFVIRLWTAPVRLCLELDIIGPDLNQGRWVLAIRFPGEFPRLYRFDEKADPPRLGERLDIPVDENLFKGPLGGPYRVPIE